MTNNIHSLTNQKPDKTLHPNDRILRWPETRLRVGLCRSQVHKLVAQNKFPAPIKLGGCRASGWLESEVNSWLEDRIAESRSNSPQAA